MATPTDLTPRHGGRAKPVRAQGPRRVILFSILLAAIGIGFYIPAPGHSLRTDVSPFVLVALTMGFGLSQLSIVRVGGRSDAEDIEFSAVLLLVAAFFLEPRMLVDVAVVGTFAVNLALRRGWLKVMYNTCHRGMTVAVFAFITARAIPDPHSASIPSTFALFVAGVILFGFVEPILVSTVLFLYRRTPIKPFHSTMLMVSACHCAIGLLAANAWVQVKGGAPLALLAAGVYVVAVYAFSQVEQRAARAEVLQSFIRAVDSTLTREQMLLKSAPLIAGAMRASTAHLYVFSRDGETGVDAWSRGENIELQPLRVRNNEVWPHGDLTAQIISYPRVNEDVRDWLDGFGAREAILVPMFDGEAVSGVVIAGDRPENDRVFDEQDEELLIAMTSHLAISLERQRLHDRLQHGALHDVLTDVPNRRLFHQRLEQCIFRARNDDEPFSIVMVDLDGFKEVNDAHGHHVGDELLVRIALRLRELVRPEDTVARLGGDEFAVVLPAATESDASTIAERLRNLLSVTMVIESQDVHVGASVGVAGWNESDETGDDVLRRADAAMYEEKRRRQVNLQPGADLRTSSGDESVADSA